MVTEGVTGWDPGIGATEGFILTGNLEGVAVNRNRGDKSDSWGFDSLKERGIGEITRRSAIKGTKISIWANIKTQSISSKGMDSDLLLFFCNGKVGLRKKTSCQVSDKSFEWGFWCDLGLNYDMANIIMDMVEIDWLHGRKLWWGEMGIGFQYKRSSCFTIAISSYPLFFYAKKTKSFLIVLTGFLMTQGHLVGSSGIGSNGEGNRKRLKISVPHFDNSALIKSFSKTLIGRCLNPPEQDMKALFQNLPKIWHLENRVSGSDLGFGRFQFVFEREEDMNVVLMNQPYHFDYWMLALACWQPMKAQSFPSEIPFWIRPVGVPMELRTAPTLESLGDAVGKTIGVDVENGRVQVVVDSLKELCFETSMEFKGGEFYDRVELSVSLRYEKLFGFCQECGSLNHKEENCLLRKKSPERKRDIRDGVGGRHDGEKHEDRARSYRGVVLNGNGSSQYKGRENRDQYGKGKGKMHDDKEGQWVKVAEKGNRSGYNKRGPYQGSSEGSRQKHSRDEEQRGRDQGERGGVSNGKITTPVARDDGPEEGEIKLDAVSPQRRLAQNTPSQEFQDALSNTQAEGNEVLSNPVDVAKGLQTVREMVEESEEVTDDHVMDMDEIKASLLEHGIDMDAEFDDQEFSESFLEEDSKEQEEDSGALEAELDTVVPQGNREEEGLADLEVAKTEGTRKRLFKQPGGAMGSSKMRNATALLSPRKRAAAKTGPRDGGGNKRKDGKGTSNPKEGTQSFT
ncbi:hypothetical protein Rs2_14475 [Raphanus sativus]|nr:hypothetical protein Rs2_14475 [Raphanus sativus]